MRKINGVLLLVIPLLFCLSCKPAGDRKDLKKPNVIIIYTDDLGYGDLTCYNSDSKIATPHIDELARGGMKFTDVHSAASFCTPSRYSILTGTYCWRKQSTSELQGGFDKPIIGVDENTLGNMFQNNGYQTAAIGKWHVGMRWTLKDGVSEQEEENVDFEKPLKFTPVDQGFDYFFGTSGCTSDDSPFAFIENRQVLGLPLSPVNDLQVVGDFNRETGEVFYKDVLIARGWAHEKADTIFTKRAISFIKKQAEDAAPFFVYLALSLPHIPWQPAEFVSGKSGDGPRGDLVALTDYCVGEIMGALKLLNLEDNTIVVFTSDNGPREGVNGHRSAGSLRGYKGSIYEGGHRVPFIVRWPDRVAANSASDEMLGQTDLYATLARIIGHPMSDNEAVDSYDFTPVLLGEKLSKPIRSEYIHYGFAIRKGDWKLIFDSDITAKELYNLNDDLSETRNLIDEYPEIVEELKLTFVEISKSPY